MSDFEAGDPACLMAEVCPVCGAVPDPAHGHGCEVCAPTPIVDPDPEPEPPAAGGGG